MLSADFVFTDFESFSFWSITFFKSRFTWFLKWLNFGLVIFYNSTFEVFGDELKLVSSLSFLSIFTYFFGLSLLWAEFKMLSNFGVAMLNSGCFWIWAGWCCLKVGDDETSMVPITPWEFLRLSRMIDWWSTYPSSFFYTPLFTLKYWRIFKFFDRRLNLALFVILSEWIRSLHGAGDWTWIDGPCSMIFFAFMVPEIDGLDVTFMFVWLLYLYNVGL